MNLAGLVAQAYPSPEWAVFYEVSNATGFGARRRADAVAMGIWPSRGHSLVGFEFKEDRHDWKNELKNPAKAEEVAKHCDTWYVVAGRKGVVQESELPAPWGLYVANEDRTKLVRAKAAVPFPDRDPHAVKRTFIAAMLRKVTETTVARSELERLVAERVKAERENSRPELETKALRNKVEALQRILDEFKAKTGIELVKWEYVNPRLVDAVHAVLEIDRDRDTLVRTQRILQNAANQIDTALAGWPRLVAGKDAADA